MTDEERERLAMREWNIAMEECDREKEEIKGQLNSEGVFLEGLDAYQSYYRPASEKLRRRLKEIQDTYRDEI